jgi:toxin HigB-1
MKVSFSKSFIKTFDKKIKHDKLLEEEFWKCVQIFIKNPFDRQLKTHKLSGKLNELWSFSVDHHTRVVFFFTPNNQESVLVDIGGHDEVY